MSAPTYLYSWGRRRHIKDPDANPGMRPDWSAQAFCGEWFDTDGRMLENLCWWDTHLANARMERKRSEPVCKRCLRAHERAVTS